MKNKKFIALYVSEEMHNKLLKRAKKEKRDLSKQLRFIISQYFEDIEG